MVKLSYVLTKDFVGCLPVRFFRDVTKTVNGDRGYSNGEGENEKWEQNLS